MGKFLGTYMQTCIIKILGNNFQQQLQHPITKKADAEPKKSRSNKKSRCRTSLLKNGPTKLPCLLIILASWVDFFDIGLLLYPVPHHTLQCCTRKSFWVTRTGESKLFCIGFSLFWSRCRTWCTFSPPSFQLHCQATKDPAGTSCNDFSSMGASRRRWELYNTLFVLWWLYYTYTGVGYVICMYLYRFVFVFS